VEPTREELEAWHCWERGDQVGGRPAMTAFRRRVRLHQARWRERHGHPVGTQPIVPRAGKPVRPVGSRLPLEYAQESGANFVTPAARDAAQARAATVEPHQTFDRKRFWSDLLWSPSMAVNLFGELAGDPDLCDRATHRWWPDAPGRATEVRFSHSPGRLDPRFLNSLRAFDAAIVLDLGGGSQGVIGVGVNYHEWAKPETPRPENRERYLQVAERSGAFRAGVTDELVGRSALAVMWLEHLLVLSMLQHGRGTWAWARYVVVHPAGNSDVAEMCDRYRSLLADTTTFSSITTEELLDAGALPPPIAAVLSERYLPT
jgi:hypothetical protein